MDVGLEFTIIDHSIFTLSLQPSHSGSLCTVWWRMPYMEVAWTTHSTCECWYPTWSSASMTLPSPARQPRPPERERRSLGCLLAISPSLYVHRYTISDYMYMYLEQKLSDMPTCMWYQGLINSKGICKPLVILSWSHCVTFTCTCTWISL